MDKSKTDVRLIDADFTERYMKSAVSGGNSARTASASQHSRDLDSGGAPEP